MIASAASRLSDPRIILGLCIGTFCLLATRMLTSGSELQAYMLLGLAAAPFLLYAALLRPLIFPFGIYVLLVPLDNILGVSSGQSTTITKLLGIAAGVFFLLLAVRRKHLAVRGSSVALLAIFVGWMVLSVVWALDVDEAFQAIPTYAGLILLYISLAFIQVSRAEFRFVLLLIVMGGIGAAFYGANMFYHDPSLAAGDPTTTRLIVQSGTQSIDPNHFANALLLPAAIVMMWTLRAGRLVQKLLGMAALTLLTVAIFLSGSREALGGLLIIVVYFLWRSRYRAQVAAAAVVVGCLAASVQTSIWTRFALLFSGDGGSGRTSIWSVGLEAAKHRWFQGYGIGNFPTAYDLYYIGVHQLQPYGWNSPAHNIVLHYVVELGVVGFAIVVAFFYCEFRSMRHIKRDSDLYDYRLVMEASLLAIVFVGLTIDLFTYKYAWLVFSMIVMLRNALPDDQTSADILSTSSAIMPARPARF